MAHTRLYVDGEWRAPHGTGSIEVVDPATEQVVGSVPAGDAQDADAAVRAARAAFEGWAATPLETRLEKVSAIVDGLEKRAAEMTAVIMSEVGTPRMLAEPVQVQLVLHEARGSIEVARRFEWEERIANSIVVKDPIGVVVSITPWNFPLVQLMRKLVPAVSSGCTFVAKPSEVTPLSAMVLAEIVDEAGLPPGVINVVTGEGPSIGEALVAHPEVDMVSLTGSVRAGRRVSELAAGTIKRVSLELGGKSAMVMLDDAETATTVASTLQFTYMNGGQTCTALTRLLVPRGRKTEVEQAVVEASRAVTIGVPDSDAQLGPLVSGPQRDRVTGYIQRGVDDGATLLLDGRENLPDGPGYFVGPTVFTDVTPGMAIEQEEIFGPVLAIVAYDDEDEAVRIANGTDYGLAAAVVSSDDSRARTVARRLRAGQIVVNGSDYNPLAPFGGYKQSGNGRENGRYGLEEYLEPKNIQL